MLVSALVLLTVRIDEGINTMREKLLTGVLPMILLACVSSANAMETAACLGRLKSVDERIASGEYSDQSVQVAKQMRDSIMQSCAYLSDATITPMMEGFEQLLPTRSEAEQQAHEEAKKAERSEQRDAQRAELAVRQQERAERKRREAANKPKPLLVSDILKRPPTARSVLAETIDRDDGMYYAELQDWDTFQGKARILYSTAPSREQFVAGTAQHHLYVIEADTSGVLTQRRVMDMPIQRVVAAGLRRGYDEVILQQRPPRLDRPLQLERWSISDRKQLSSVTAPTLPGSTESYFCVATSDGNVLFAANDTASKGPNSIAWLEVSPDGNISRQGRISSEADKLSKSDASCFDTSGGGGGFIIDVTSIDEDGLDSELDTPLKRHVGDAELEAVVQSERRLLVTNDSDDSAWQSPAIARRFMWRGLEKLGPMMSLSAQEELDKITGDVDFQYGGNSSVVNRQSDDGYRSATQAVGDGYGVLIYGRSLAYEHSGVNGSWFYEYAANGDLRETNLDPTGEFLGIRFDMFAAPNEDSVTLYGEPYVILLDQNREVTGYGKTSSGDKMYPGGMIAEESGVWIFGQSRRNESIQRLLVERIEF